MPENSTLYDMCMLFNLDINIKPINDIMNHCGITEKIIAEKAITVKITQTVSFIPTDETIKKYEDIIKENYSKNEKCFCEKCTFAGYEYLRPVSTKHSNKE